MINFIWALWLLIIVIFTIILLNFLIAAVSQSYEQTLNKDVQKTYIQRAELNLDVQLFRNYIIKLFYLPLKVTFKFGKFSFNMADSGSFIKKLAGWFLHIIACLILFVFGVFFSILFGLKDA
jgi:hypothetical protein